MSELDKLMDAAGFAWKVGDVVKLKGSYDSHGIICGQNLQRYSGGVHRSYLVSFVDAGRPTRYLFEEIELESMEVLP